LAAIFLSTRCSLLAAGCLRQLQIRNRRPTQWSGAQTTAKQGLVIPKGYGTFNAGGNVIDSYVETIGNQQYMNVLLSYGHGIARSIKNIKINDNPVENYTGVTIEKRMGYLDQSCCFVLPQPHQRVEHQRQSNFTGTTIAGHRSDVEGLQIEVSFPKGLYSLDKNGNFQNRSVQWKVEYRLNAGSWQNLYAPLGTTPVGGTPVWVAISTTSWTVTTSLSTLSAASLQHTMRESLPCLCRGTGLRH
jgi:hypothetical protein